MNNRPSTRHNGLSILFASGLVWLSTHTLADDVEIFVSTDDQEFTCEVPNVLFIIDTSGSMDTEVLTQAPWNPSQTYDGCFDSGRIYYSEAGMVPECGHQFTFSKEDQFCAAAVSSTEYTGLFQAWDPEPKTWGKIPDSNEDRLIECAADEGTHGRESGDETYAVDGIDGPWSNEMADRIAWGANATSATLYDGNWLNWQSNPPTFTRSRLDVVKEVVNSTLDNMGNVNVGLMQFNSHEGGPVIEAVNSLTENRTQLKQTINNLSPDNRTPLSETVYEAGQYLAGRLVDFGDKDSDNRSVAASRTGNTLASDRYLSPLTVAGQNNYIVLLSDGEPSDDTSANAKIEGLPDYGELVGESCSNGSDGDCLPNMAQYLNLADLRSDIEGKQNVITHTIGFAIDLELLSETAARGGGKYFVADNTASLTSALSSLAEDFSRAASLLVSPSVPINSFNRTERLNEVYLSLFEPATTYHWPGNLKKYEFVQTDTGALLIGADGRPALSEDGNFIDSSATSLWSDSVDGENVSLGGAASRLLDPSTRELLTNASATLTLSALEVGNSAITAAMLAAPADERDTVIQWARGFDARDANGDGNQDDPRLSMGDPLHVQPITGDYGDDENSRNPVVFVATNDGYLHAVDARDGHEIWAFVPQRLLKRLYSLSLDEAAQNKQYGLDGDLVLITGHDGKPETLLFGMRRGGEALYSLNVSNRDTPELNWIVDSSQPDFLDMGQTWSPPVVRDIKIGAQVHTVAIFGGGYDSGQDNREHRLDTKGNAIYFVDVETGDLLWSAGSPQARSDHDRKLERMNYSIPAGIRVSDQNADGLADRMYVGDMGGQIWRFDIIRGNNRSNLVEGGVLASLGAADLPAPPPPEDVRRFYNTPDIVNVVKGLNIFLSINIGSGYRAHPLDTRIYDEFFSVRDFDSTHVIPTDEYGSQAFPLITRDDLKDITGDASAPLEPTDAGWRLGMVQDDGEKILGESLTIDNVLFFNSFAPISSGQSCLPGAGINRNYRVSLIHGNALTNLDNSEDDENLTPEDRFIEGDIGAPISGPAFGPDDVVCSGLDCFDGDREFGDDDDDDDDDSMPSKVKKTYWRPVEAP